MTEFRHPSVVKMPRRDMPPIYDVLFQSFPKQEIILNEQQIDSSQDDSCSSPEIVQNHPLFSPTLSFKFISSPENRKPSSSHNSHEQLLDDYVDDFMSDFVDIFVEKFIDSVVEEKANDIFNEHMFDMIIESKQNS
ncbi:unnamed protein product [Oikopleura dioica]|uniref:Uncharacterized protein n=1 Tax=Oikopleura dioica TaxID=34765 RepID=E4Y709_OIKDI|nr:unnamed protein product [Oikopleura dioica]